jgi:hypothetical protein
MNKWIGKNFGWGGRDIILKYYDGICLGRLRKIMKNLSEDGRLPGQYLKPRSPEYEARLLTTWSGHSVVIIVHLFQIKVYL